MGGDDDGVRAPDADEEAEEVAEAADVAVEDVLLTGSEGELFECDRRGAGCPGRPPSPLLRELLLPDVESATGGFAAGGAPIEANTEMKPPDSAKAAAPFEAEDASPFEATNAAATTGLAAEFDADGED